jgi:hypothetical protein
MISLVNKYSLSSVLRGGGGGTGSGGGSNQSLNAAMGNATPEQRNESYGPGPSDSDRGGGGGGGITSIDTSQAAARQEAERQQAAAQAAAAEQARQEQIARDRARDDAFAQQQQAAAAEQARQEQIARDTAARQDFERQQAASASTGIPSIVSNSGNYDPLTGTTRPSMSPAVGGVTTSVGDSTGLDRFGGTPTTTAVAPEQPAQLETPAVPRVDLPFFAKYQMDPASLGMPLILSGVAAGFAPTTTPSPGGYSFYNPSSGAIPSPAYSGSPYTPTPLGQNLGLGNDVIRTDNSGNLVFTGGKGITPTISSDIKNPSYLSGLAKVESSLNPLAKSTTSTASGLFGFIDKTFTDTLSKMGYDTSTLTKDQLDALKSNPQVSAKVAEAFTNQNAAALSYANLDASDPANLYVAHLLGPTLAIKALTADPNTPISGIATAKQIEANPKLLGGDKTVGDVLGNLGDKINSAISSSGNFVGNIFNNTTSTASDVLNAAVNAPSNFADTLGSILNGTFTPTSETSNPVPPVSIPTPSEDNVTNEGIRAALMGGTKLAGTQITPKADSSQVADLTGTKIDAVRSPEESAAGSAIEEIGGAPGGDPNAANIKPMGEIDWSKGNLPFVDNTKAKEELYNQPNPNFPDDPSIANSVTGDTPETYAQKFLNGDVSQVQSRISYANGFPQVEFFAKGLDQVGGEILSGIASVPGALISAVGNIFNPPPKTDLSYLPINPNNPGLGNSSSDTGGISDYSGQSSDRLGDIVGNDNVSNPVTRPITVAETPTNPVPVEVPRGIEALGLDLARRKYVHRGTVRTTSHAYPEYQPSSRFA